MTIRQALKNGCTWLDLQFDHAHGNLKIRAAAPVTDNDSKNKKHGPKLKRGIPIRRASSGQRARTDKDQYPPVSLQCQIRCNGISRGYDTNTRRYRGDGTKETHIRIGTNCDGKAKPDGPHIMRSSVTPVHIDYPVPSDVQHVVSVLRSSAWGTQGAVPYRRCCSLQFGFSFTAKRHLSRGSRDFPQIQAMILAYLTSIQPRSCFSSFIVNRYEVGDQMCRHSDHNMLGHPMQFVLIWGEFTGGDLVVYNTDGRQIHKTIGQTTLLIDGNAEHEVSPVTSGIRYSIVTYAKHTFAKCDENVREELRQYGFPLPTLSIGSLRRARVGHVSNAEQ